MVEEVVTEEGVEIDKTLMTEEDGVTEKNGRLARKK